MATTDLRVFPVLNKSTEGVREKINAYIDSMNMAGKPVQQITLFADDYDTCVRAINTQLGKGIGRDQPKPEAVDALTWGGGIRNTRPSFRAGALN